MKEFRVFSYIGAFSVELDSGKSVIRSMRYALESMKRERACLFIFPEGRINTPADELPPFESGIGWLVRKCMEEDLDVDIVPVAVHTHLMTASKPELWVEIGKPVERSALRGKTLSGETPATNEQITALLHKQLNTQVKELKKSAYSEVFPRFTPLVQTPQ